MDPSEFALHARIEDVHWWFMARRAILLDALKKYVPQHQGRTVAEIGCGTGGNLNAFREYYDVLGVDISSHAVEFARQRPGLTVHCGDFRDVLRGRWQHLDAVVLADVLEHVGEDFVFLNDIIRRLKSGACLVVTVPAHRFLWSGHDEALGHKRRYGRRELRRLWKDSAVDELFFSSFNCMLFSAIACFRLVRRDSGRQKSDLYLPAPWINAALYGIFSLDRLAMKFASLPLGTSYLAVLRKR